MNGPKAAWIRRPKPNTGAQIRLFCFPFAGGGASAFRQWAARLPSYIEVCPVQPPGREERHAEPGFTDLLTLARAIAAEIEPLTEKPYVLFGHSMGTLTCFEIARIFRRMRVPLPALMLLAAHSAPHLPRTKTRHLLSDTELVDEIRRLKGTSEAVLDNEDLVRFLLPVLRADFEACDTYRYLPEAPLDCPIVVYGGIEDAEVESRELQAWREQTTMSFTLEMLPGNHFFIQSQREALLDDISRRIGSILNPAD